MTWTASTFAAQLAARLVALDEGPPEQTIEWRHLAQQLASAPAQNNRSLSAQVGAHNCQCTPVLDSTSPFYNAFTGITSSES